MHCNAVLCCEPEETWNRVLWIFLPWQQYLLWVLCKCFKMIFANKDGCVGWNIWIFLISSPLVGSEWPVWVYSLCKPVDENLQKRLESTHGLSKCSFSTSVGLGSVHLWQKLSFFSPLSFFYLPVQVELNKGNNVLYWRTTSFSVLGSAVKPVLLRNIAISGRSTPVMCSGQLSQTFDSSTTFSC